jgi:hypothetical protein
MRRVVRLAAEKKLISREEVEEDHARKIHAVKGGLTTFERAVLRDIAGKSAAEQQAIIHGKLADILDAYRAGWEGTGDEIPKRGVEEGTK